MPPQSVRVFGNITEVVVDPAALIPGERWQSLEEARARRRLVRDRLARTGMAGQGGRPMPLVELLGDLPGWEITEVGQVTTVFPLAVGHNGRSYGQFSLGNAAVGRTMLWHHSLDRTWPRELRHLAWAGRDFGRRVAGELASRITGRGEVPVELVAFLSAIPDVDEVWGHAWRAFTQVAARPLNVTYPQLLKNWLTVASRHAFDTDRRALRPDTRGFLDKRHDGLSAIAHDMLHVEMERHFRLFKPGGGVVPEGFFDVEVRDAEVGDVPSAREHLTAALTGLTSQGRRIGPYEAVGMDGFPALDTGGGRLRVPLMVDEFRAYGFDHRWMTEEQIDRAEAELVELGRAMYEWAVAASVPLSREVLSRSVERILGDPVVRGFAPFLTLLGEGIPRADGPNLHIMTELDGMAAAVALGRYALGHVRLSADSPEYRP
ncbi:hypothetical protein AB4Z54_23545, partial [Streptomyces sp. MCAF7]